MAQITITPQTIEDAPTKFGAGAQQIQEIRRNLQARTMTAPRSLFRARSTALALAVVACCSAASALAYPPMSQVMVYGSQWMGGAGVPVFSNGSPGNTGWYAATSTGYRAQCVELPQRLYYTRGWYGSGIFPGVNIASDIYYKAGSLGMQPKGNGSGYVPVPGDMVVMGSPYHVGVVDYITATKVCTCEQNWSDTGKRCYGRSGYNGSYLKRDIEGGTVLGVVHSPKNPLTNASTTYPVWLFGSSLEGWSALWSSTGLTWWADGYWPGIIYGDQTGPDIEWAGPNTSFIGGDNASVNVQVYPQNGNTTTHDMQLFWRTADSNYYSGDKDSAIVTYHAQDAFKRINLSANSLLFSGHTITGLRLDFDQENHGNRWIVNHVLVQTTPRHYFDAGPEGWASANALTPIVWCKESCGWPGIIYADQTGPDAYFVGPTIAFIGGANDAVNVEIFPQNGGSAHDARLYWRTYDEPYFSDDKSVLVNYSGVNQYIDLSFKVGANPKWWAQNLTGLRLDVDSVNTGTRWVLNYVKVDHGTTD